MTLENNHSLTTEEITQAFQSGNIATICETLVTLALYDPDWKQVQAYCLEFLEHPDAGVRMVAATCIGHLARIHQHLDLDLVLPALYRHQSDQGPYVAGTVDNALSSIERFMHVPVKRDPAMRGDNVVDIELEEDDEEEEPPLTEEVVEQAFQSGDKLEIERTLIALAFRDPDWRRTETYCLQFLEHPDASVRGVAVDCFSHLIYNQHHLDADLARSALLKHLSDPSEYVVEHVKDTLSDIERFVKSSSERDLLTDKNKEIDIAEKASTSHDLQPTNGQRTLDNSVSIPSNVTHRIGIDMYTGEIVVFDNTNGTYQGYVQTWNQLNQVMKNILIDNGLIDEIGSIILRDARGNIIGQSKNVMNVNVPFQRSNSALEEDGNHLLTAEEVEQAFQSGDTMQIERTLIALALRDPDWQRTEAYCLQFLEHQDTSVRGVAVDCISHLIYNQHHLDADLARSALLRHQSDPSKYVSKNVKYALSDIELFVKASAQRDLSKGKE